MEKLAAGAIKRGAVQKLDELVPFLEALPPHLETVVEIGCDAGGMLWLWGQLAEHVYGVTLELGPYSTGNPLKTYGATMILGDSHDQSTRAELDFLLPDNEKKIDLLFIDGDHSYMGAVQDWIDYGPWAKLVAFHDIVPHEGLPQVGVHQLWKVLGSKEGEFIRPDSKDGGIGLVRNWS